MPLTDIPGYQLIAGTGGTGLCDDGGGGGEDCIGDIPVITSLDPSSATEGASEFTLTITGTGFRPSALASFNGTELATTFVSETELTATVTADLVDTSGSFDIVVTNPTPGCGPGDPFPFNVSTSGLRFAVDESSWLGSFDRIQFRIQEAGSRNCYRRVMSVGSGDFIEGEEPQAIRYRFSPDGTKLAILCDFFLGDREAVVKVLDLGTTLQSGGDWGEVDGFPQEDVFILDADVINEAELLPEEIAGTGGWFDVAVDNNGTIRVLENDATPDVVQEEALWVLSSTVDQATGIKTGDITLAVGFDSRAAANTSIATVRIRKCCGGGCSTDLDLDITPGEAWWSPSVSPVTATCQPTAVEPEFCQQLGFQLDFFECNGASIAEAEFTITADKTGKVAGVYIDEDTFDFNTTHACYGSYCMELEGPSGEITSAPVGMLGDGITIAPSRVVMSIGVPTTETLRIKVKPVGEALTVQAELDGATSVHTQSDSTVTALLDPTLNQIVNHWYGPDIGGDRLNQVPVVVDIGEVGGAPVATMENFDAVSRVFLNLPPSDNWPDVNRYGAFSCYTALGQEDVIGASGRFHYVIFTDGTDFRTFKFTNAYEDILPKLVDVFGSGQDWHPQMLFKDATSGYLLGQFVDFELRQFTADLEAETVTVEDAPGTLLVTPGDAFPSRVRGIEPYDGHYTSGAETDVPYPLVRAIGFGGVAPEEQ